MKIVAFAITALAVLMTSGIAYAQVTPTPVPTLSLAAGVLTILSLLVGIVNQAIQTGKILNHFRTPAAVGPYLVTLGSFLAGVYAYLAQQIPLVINGTTLFYAVTAGVGMLLVGSVPAAVVHQFGGQVNAKRPPPEPGNALPPVAKAFKPTTLAPPAAAQDFSVNADQKEDSL